MTTAESILTELKAKGKETTRALYSRHGMAMDRTLGVLVSDLKPIAKAIKGRQDLALQLYDSALMEPMYLAGMVADGKQMTANQLQSWAEGAEGLPMIAETTVPWVAVENQLAAELATKWMADQRDQVSAAGWCTYSGLVTTQPDVKLDLKEVEKLLKAIPNQIHKAQNRTKLAMNGFVIAVGSYVSPLMDLANQTANQIGELSVDMGDTACKIRLASESIAKVHATGKAGIKRKTIRC